MEVGDAERLAPLAVVAMRVCEHGEQRRRVVPLVTRASFRHQAELAEGESVRIDTDCSGGLPDEAPHSASRLSIACSTVDSRLLSRLSRLFSSMADMCSTARRILFRSRGLGVCKEVCTNPLTVALCQPCIKLAILGAVATAIGVLLACILTAELYYQSCVAEARAIYRTNLANNGCPPKPNAPQATLSTGDIDRKADLSY